MFDRILNMSLTSLTLRKICLTDRICPKFPGWLSKQWNKNWSCVYGIYFLINFLTLICIKWVPEDSSSIFLATIFTQKKPESSGSKYSSILMLESIWCHRFAWSGSNSQEIVNLFQFNSVLQGPTIGTKFTISYEFGPLQVKWWCHIFSKMK